jgi:hypothetical protein
MLIQGTGIRRLLRKFGYDIIVHIPKPLGINPMMDIKKFINCKKPVVFDIGANIGQTVTEIKQHYKHSIIYSFEPSEDTFSILMKNISTYKNVYPFNIAVGEESGKKIMYENKLSDMSSFLKMGEDG